MFILATSYFQNVEVEPEDFLRDLDLGFVVDEDVLVHLLEGVFADAHVDLGDLFLELAEELVQVALAVGVQLL